MTGPDTSIAINQLEAHPIELDDQGYDDNGCYWGVGTTLYWVTTPDGKHDAYVRADDAVRARLLAAEEIPLRAWEREQAEIDRSTPAIVEPEHLPDGSYGYSDEPVTSPMSQSTDRIRTTALQRDSATGQANEATQASPARPTGKTSGSGTAGRAGPT